MQTPAAGSAQVIEALRLSPVEVNDTLSAATSLERVSVLGQVVDLRLVDEHWVYGELKEINGVDQISFRCPAHSAPSLPGQVVEITGVIKTRVTSSRVGLQIELRGKCTYLDDSGNTLAEPSHAVPERALPKTSLSQLLSEQSLSDLYLMGSRLSIDDCLYAARKCGDVGGVTCRVVALNDEREVVASIQTSAAAGAKALFFVRGGNDPAPPLWNQPPVIEALIRSKLPFYTALGGKGSLTAADMYSDQAFISPTDLGHAIGDAFIAIDAAATEREEKTELCANVASLWRSIDELERKLKSSDELTRAANRRGRCWRFSFLAALLSAATLAAALVYPIV